jgi:ABC-type uncharacterized transport system permease subunit
MTTTLITAIAATVCYLAATLVIGLRLFRSGAEWVPPRSAGLTAMAVGLVLHALLVYQDTFTPSGLNLGFFHVGSLSALVIVLLLLASSLGKPVENLGLVLLPMAILTIFLELRFSTTRLLGEEAPSGLTVHVLISILAYSVLSLAAVQSLLLAIQNNHLRNRHPGGFIRALPPLQTMETLLFEMIGVGFFLLSLALVTGFMFLENIFAQHLVHKTVLGIASWVVFGTLLWGRFRFGWRGRTAIIWTLSGFVVLMLAYFGSKAVLELILQREPPVITLEQSIQVFGTVEIPQGLQLPPAPS